LRLGLNLLGLVKDVKVRIVDIGIDSGEWVLLHGTRRGDDRLQRLSHGS
jgi:hypothetical protein